MVAAVSRRAARSAGYSLPGALRPGAVCKAASNSSGVVSHITRRLSAIPVDQFSLNFAKIECEYKEQKSDGTLGGTVKMGWDVKQHKSV